MAIFFPLFTLLEDFGYLPRVAYNLDRWFERAHACGKQSLTMCMGLGCNAAGVVGCRIIGSGRERLIAILTNNFMPCNGRFPLLIAMFTLFFGAAGGVRALMLAAEIALGVMLTLLCSRLLSALVLRGEPSPFILELPPYRVPRVGQVIVRSVLDRTIKILGRAVAVSVPAGLLIWLLANIEPGGVNLLARAADALDAPARFIGLDGVILLAFILASPANEIVIPVILMGYTAGGALTEAASLAELRGVLTANGWTWTTALCTALFSLAHWPCATACLTIKKETGSIKWTAVSILLPTAVGVILCAAVNFAARVFGG